MTEQNQLGLKYLKMKGRHQFAAERLTKDILNSVYL